MTHISSVKSRIDPYSAGRGHVGREFDAIAVGAEVLRAEYRRMNRTKARRLAFEVWRSMQRVMAGGDE